MRKVLLIIFLLVISLNARVGKIVTSKGEVIVNRENQKIQAKAGFRLFKSDKITTGKYARAQIVFADNTIISLGKNSTILVSEYFYEVGSKPKATFTFASGSFNIISGKISKLNQREYKLKTKFASIDIRGTILGLDLNENDEVYMVFEGKIIVNNDSKQTFLKSGKIVTYKSGTLQRVQTMSRKTKELFDKKSGSIDNEKESGLGIATQTKMLSSSEKKYYR